MSVNNKDYLCKFDKLKLIFINFFPTFVFSVTSTYLLNVGEEPQGFFMSNVLISICLVLVPMLLSISMLITKTLYEFKPRLYELTSVGLGFICLSFLIIVYTYQYFSFVEKSIPIVSYYFTLSVAVGLSAVFSILIFTKKYFHFLSKLCLEKNKFKYLVVSVFIPILLTTLSLKVINSLVLG